MPVSFTKSILLCTATVSVAFLSACGGGSGGGGGSSPTTSGSTPTPTPTPSAEFTMQGVAAKGLLDGARVLVVDAGEPLPLELSGFNILGEGTTSATGDFSIEVQDSGGAANLLVLALMDNANMKCDSAIGCGLDPVSGAQIGFGDDFALGPNSSILSAYVPTPGAGTTTANLNSLSSIVTSRMIGLAAEAGSTTGSGEDTQPILRPQDKQAAQDYVAQVLGITSQEYSALNFIDLTEPLPASVDQAELRASLLASGFLTSAVAFGSDLEASGIQFTFDDLFDEITGSFFVPEALIVRESPANMFSISLQEMFGGAVFALDANVQASGGTATNAQDLALDYLVGRLTEINSAAPNLPIESGGTLPQPPAEISFVAESISYINGSSPTGNLLVEIDNPDTLFPLNSSQGVPAGETSFFAEVTSVSPAQSIGLNLSASSPTELDISFGGNLTAGTYETEVTFTVSEFDQTYTDTIIFEILPTGIGIAQESVSMTTSPDSSFRLDFVNPNNVDISFVNIDNPNGASYFEVGSIDATGAVVGYSPSIGVAPTGTYNVSVLLSRGLGAEASDVIVPLEIVVSQ